MKDKLVNSLNTPWKLIDELLMYILKPLVWIYLKVCGVEIGKNSKFYGFPLIHRHRGSLIRIGNSFECRSWWFSNPLGLNHPTILCTWSKGAKLLIGDDVGISGGSVVAAKSVRIGDGTLIGANSTIIDTDFHPVKSRHRRYDKSNIKSKPIRISKNVFIGMNSLILKGTSVSDNSVIPAGAIVIRKHK
jgi:acetyltransferase-like isoleucine patch superfamily enzyme